MSDPHSAPTFVPPDAATLSVLFPGYDFEGLIATGGMGAVYYAIQRSLERPVAIKILPREFGEDPSFRESFEAEAKAMAKLNHPNLIGVYDFGEVDGMLFIIMEFVSGGSLYQYAYGRQLDGVVVGQMVAAVCEGLAHAHEHGILHRDIKPANILLDAQERPKIGDFGLARVIGKQADASEVVYGTPHYTAPEVVNHPNAVDARADIFSVGVMLHELLTGNLPAHDPRPASAISGCDVRFDAIIKRATNPLPDLRYNSAAAMAKDIRIIVDAVSAARVRGGPGAGPKRPGGAPMARPGVRRPTRAVVTKSSGGGSSGILVVLLLALAAGAVYFYVKKKNANAAPPPSTSEVPIPGTEKTPPKPAPSQTGSSNGSSNPFGTRDSSSSSNSGSTSPSHEGSSTPDTPKTDLTSIDPVEPQPRPDAPSDFVEKSNPTNKSSLPTAATQEFLNRATDIMRKRIQSDLATHKDALAKNLAEFERSIKRQIRKLEQGRDDMETQIDQFVTEAKAAENYLPSIPPIKLGGEGRNTEFKKIYEEAIGVQQKADQQLAEVLKTQSKTYILGIEMEIKRRRAQNDNATADSLAEEISKTNDDPEHFETRMLGKPIAGFSAPKAKAKEE